MSNCNPSMTKAGLLKRLNEVSFAVNDIHLFLDTHPCDEKALAFFQEVSEERNRLLKEYASSFGPLTIDTAACSREDVELDNTAISVGTGRRLQIIYVEL